MKWIGLAIMIGSCVLAFYVNGGYTCALLFLIGFGCWIVGEEREKSLK